MDAVVSRKTDSFNHPRTEERLWGVIYNTGMIHYQPCQEIQNLHRNSPQALLGLCALSLCTVSVQPPPISFTARARRSDLLSSHTEGVTPKGFHQKINKMIFFNELQP
ncbi:hypothetical protein DFY52_20895 [Escherichia coli]|nr:hypothetical protein [Escherichia coli]EFB1303415.1 hypothetical protein [Escherichia coli]